MDDGQQLRVGGQGEILLAGDVDDWLDCIQEVMLSFLALCLRCFGTFLAAVLLSTAVTGELPSAEGALSGLFHLDGILVVLQSFYCNPPQSERTSIIDNRCQLCPHCRIRQIPSSVPRIPSVHESTHVNVCKPLSTPFTEWQKKSPQDSPR